MLKKENIKKYLYEINEALAEKNIKGEICLYGGAVMCLVFNARPSTKDVDAIFKPSKIIRDISRLIAEKYDLDKNWLNDGVKGFLVEHPQKIIFNWSHLNVYVADPEYLLAMKALAARVDSTDKEDIIYLINALKFKKSEQIFNLIEKYYPKNQIKPATQFFIEELFEK